MPVTKNLDSLTNKLALTGLQLMYLQKGRGTKRAQDWMMSFMNGPFGEDMPKCLQNLYKDYLYDILTANGACVWEVSQSQPRFIKNSFVQRGLSPMVTALKPYMLLVKRSSINDVKQDFPLPLCHTTLSYTLCLVLEND